AGVIENGRGVTCEHGQPYALFGEGGGERRARDSGAPRWGRIPLEPAVAAGGDSGVPAVLRGDGPAADAFTALAERVAEALPPVEMSDCTARLFDQVEAALGPAKR